MATLRTTLETGARSEGEVPSLAASMVPRALVSRRLNAWAVRLLTALEVIAVTLGITVYAGDPFGFVHPRLALCSVLGMAALTFMARAVAILRRHPPWLRSAEVAALLVYAALLTQSMGAANSPFIALYAITLLAAALLWQPVWVVALAILIFGCSLAQTGFLDLMDEMPLFAIVVVILNALLPAAVAGVIIAVLRQIGRAVPEAADQCKAVKRDVPSKGC